MFKLVILICKGLIRSQHARRLIMFYDVIFAMLMLFAGSSVLSHWLRHNPVPFLIYWGVCGWLTILAFLLAIFDLILLRATARRARRKLEAEYLARAQAAAQNDQKPPGT